MRVIPALTAAAPPSTAPPTICATCGVVVGGLGAAATSTDPVTIPTNSRNMRTGGDDSRSDAARRAARVRSRAVTLRCLLSHA
jgi:hypothetical protein